MFSGKWLWVIGGGLLQVPLIEQAKLLGLKVVVSDANSKCVAKEYADYFLVLDIFDIEGHLQALTDLPFCINGVLAAGIDAPETMAFMNQALGLKGVLPEVALLSQQKDLFRKAMQEKGYSTPKFKVLDLNTNVFEVLQDFGLPLIVKPPANSASRDMKIFYANELDACTEFISSLLERYDRLLIEELWHGEEQTVECLLDIEGKFHRGFITDRKFTFENGFPVETGLVHPTCLATEQQERLYVFAEKIAQDFDLQVGAVKLDTILTAEGPKLIELAVRHSGGFDCQYLVPLATGKNILKAAILTAMQQLFPPDLLTARWEKFGQTASVWPKPGVIKSINGKEEVLSTPEIAHVFMRYDVGDTVMPYEDCSRRVAFIISISESRELTASSLLQAQKTLKVITG